MNVYSVPGTALILGRMVLDRILELTELIPVKNKCGNKCYDKKLNRRRTRVMGLPF